MGRIKIDDLPEEQKINKEVMRKVMGGGLPLLPSNPFRSFFPRRYTSGVDAAIPINIP